METKLLERSINKSRLPIQILLRLLKTKEENNTIPSICFILIILVLDPICTVDNFSRHITTDNNGEMSMNFQQQFFNSKIVTMTFAI